MESRYRILLLDDDPEVLDMYKEMLSHLPSKPEVHTATSGNRALSLLEADEFRLLLCDLKMPKMDGLQVLSIVRRRFPELRTVVVTAISDEEFRSRAYALGVDLFWLKPDTHQNMKMFLECLESLLGRDSENGFRGVQSKSLMDIIQMECLSQNSLVLRMTRGALIGKIWIQTGELVDAEAPGARGEAALRKILQWKSGTFENLPAEPNRERTIDKPVNALLLEAAQAIDEGENPNASAKEEAEHRKTVWRLSTLTREGAEWVVSVPTTGAAVGWGTQASEELAKWIRSAAESAKRLSEELGAGPMACFQGNSMERRIVMMSEADKSYLVAWPPAAESSKVLEQTKKLVATWDS